MDRYACVVVAEENLQGQWAHLLFGHRFPPRVRVVTDMGRLIDPGRIVREVREVREVVQRS